MRVDGVRNNQQSTNFGAIKIPQITYDNYKIRIETLLTKELGDIHGFYLGRNEKLGMDRSGNIAYYLTATRKGTKEENDLVEKINTAIAEEIKMNKGKIKPSLAKPVLADEVEAMVVTEIKPYLVEPSFANDVRAAKNRLLNFYKNPKQKLIHITNDILNIQAQREDALEQLKIHQARKNI